MRFTQSDFGKDLNGRKVSLYTIENSKGFKLCVTDLGAAMVKIVYPGQSEYNGDVLLGYDNADGYLDNDSFIGVVIGPSCNRIAGANFLIEGHTYNIAKNDGENNLHSDKEQGIHKRLWLAKQITNGVKFTTSLMDMEMGFPGNKTFTIEYTLSEDNEVKLHYHATSDKKTIINLTNHAYFNLNGHNGGTILDHEVVMNAANFTPALPGCIPTGEILPVKGTAMDFTEKKSFARDIESGDEQLKVGSGYDHNWVIDDYDTTLRHCFTVNSAKSGRTMDVFTTLPGFQCYVGNFLNVPNGKDGSVYNRREGFAVETQFFPDSIHHKNFPSYVFGEGKEYDSTTVYKFS